MICMVYLYFNAYSQSCALFTVFSLSGLLMFCLGFFTWITKLRICISMFLASLQLSFSASSSCLSCLYPPMPDTEKLYTRPLNQSNIVYLSHFVANQIEAAVNKHREP